MALSDSFVNIAKNAAAGAATGFVSSALGGSNASRGKGSLPPGANPDKIFSKQLVPDMGRPKLLSFPSDLSMSERNMNYILFTTYKSTPGKFKPISKAEREMLSDLKREMGDTKFNELTGKTAGIAKLNKEINAGGRKATNSLQLKNFSSTASDVTIALYMPQTVQTSYNMDYQDAEIGAMSNAIYDFIKDIQAGKGLATSATEAGPTLGMAAIKMGVGVLDTALPGAKALVGIEMGAVMVPRTEVMFQGIGRREFSFTFTFMPKSEDEANEVYEIIKVFKSSMTPNFNDAKNIRVLNMPDMFGITYMHNGNVPNDYLHKIGRCFLQGMDVSYGGEKYSTFRSGKIPFGGGKGAPPTKSTMTLKFKEVEVVDREKIEDNY